MKPLRDTDPNVVRVARYADVMEFHLRLVALGVTDLPPLPVRLPTGPQDPVVYHQYQTTLKVRANLLKDVWQRLPPPPPS